MLTPEQIKGRIKNIAEKKDLRPQEVLQMFLFERVLERLSASEYKSNFILKGGLLISSMIGISERTTMDMDTTVRGIQMEEDEIVEIVKKIIAIDVDDGIQFEFQRIEPIREDDAYNNFRIHLIAKYGKINNPMKMDVTTGDVITPAAIRYDYPLILSEKTVSILAYSLETILAEKYETIIRRNIGTTRARDFYDLYMLCRQHWDEIRFEVLHDAVQHTAKKRGSLEELCDWKDILKEIREEPQLYTLWRNYVAENKYAEGLEFHVILDIVDEIAEMLNF